MCQLQNLKMIKVLVAVMYYLTGTITGFRLSVPVSIKTFSGHLYVPVLGKILNCLILTLFFQFK